MEGFELCSLKRFGYSIDGKEVSRMGKTVVITGGTRGIGLEVVKRFVENGDTVHVIGRDFSNFPYQEHPNVQPHVYDLKDISGIPELAKSIGYVDILVNNAGVSVGKNYEEYTEDDVTDILNVNLRAPLELIKIFAKGWSNKGEGRVVNVASQASEIGHTDIWYGITKAGLVNATKTLASELGPKGIVVNAVSPEPVQTDMTADPTYQERFQKIIGRTYLKRIAYASEVADVIYWLAAESPQYVNGENIDVNNGAQRI